MIYEHLQCAYCKNDSTTNRFTQSKDSFHNISKPKINTDLSGQEHHYYSTPGCDVCFNYEERHIINKDYSKTI